jgi:hypothetical protein
MSASARRLIPLLSALCLLAPAVWADPSIDSLKKKVETPDAFSNAADGSVDRPAVAAGPVSGQTPGRRSDALLAAGATAGAFRSVPAVAPPVPASSPSLRTALPTATAVAMALAAEGGLGLKARGLAAVFGLGCLLAAAGLLLETSSAPEPAPAPAAETAALLAERWRKDLAAAQREQPAPAPAAERAPEAFFVGTLAPMPSWRAISLAEQKLIDGWDRSPEKSLGRASLADWLNLKGAGSGVDVSRLLAKLERDV